MRNGAGNVLCRLRSRRFVAAVDHDAGALGGEQLGDREADPAGAADDDRATTRQRSG